MDDYRIFIDKDFLFDEDVTNEEFAIHCLLQPFKLFNFWGNILTFTTDQLCTLLYCCTNYSKNNIAAVSVALSGLIRKDYIEGEKISEGKFRINIKTLTRENLKKFVTINISSMIKIFTSNNRAKYALFRYFCTIMSTVNTKTNVGQMSEIYIASLINSSQNTISRNIIKLEEIGVLYVARKCGKNFYGLPENRGLIDLACSQYDGTNPFNSSRREHQRLAAMYNQVKAGKRYDDATMKKIKDYIIKTNNAEKYMSSRLGENYDANIRDVSILS